MKFKRFATAAEDEPTPEAEIPFASTPVETLTEHERKLFDSQQALLAEQRQLTADRESLRSERNKLLVGDLELSSRALDDLERREALIARRLDAAALKAESLGRDLAQVRGELRTAVEAARRVQLEAENGVNEKRASELVERAKAAAAVILAAAAEAKAIDAAADGLTRALFPPPIGAHGVPNADLRPPSERVRAAIWRVIYGLLSRDVQAALATLPLEVQRRIFRV
jgi:hypothetical protein